MIGIRLASGASLDLMLETTIPLDINNPLFETDVIKGTYSYPFDLPDTPANRRSLGFPEELLNAITVASSYKADIYLNAILFKSGTLNILKVVDGKITTSFIAGAGGLNAGLSQKLSQVDYGDPIPFSWTSFNVQARALPSPASVIGLAIDFTLNGVTTTFHKRSTIVVSDQTTFKAAVEELAALFIADTAGMATNNVLDVTTYYNAVYTFRNKIFFKLKDGVSGAFNAGNSDYIGNWAVDAYNSHVQAEMKEIAAKSYPDVNFNFPMIKAPDFYGSVADYTGYLNFYMPDVQDYNISEELTGQRYGRVAVPMPYLVFVLKRAIANTGYSFKGSFMDDADIKKIIIVNNYALDQMVYDAADPGNTHESNIVINKWSDFINLANHVPDISVAEFLNAVRNFFHLGFFVDDTSRVIELKFLESVITDNAYDDWTIYTIQTGKELDFNSGQSYTLKLPDQLDPNITDTVLPLTGKVKDPVNSTTDLAALTDKADGDIRLVKDLDQYYQCSRYYDGTNYTFTWAFLTENYHDYKTPNSRAQGLPLPAQSTTEIPISIRTLLLTKEQEPGRSNHFLIPTMDGDGSSRYFDIGINKMPFTILTYHGMQNDSGSELYPFASSSYKDYAGSAIGGLSLKPYNAVNGVYEKYYKSWIKFLNNTRPITRICQLDQATLTNPNMIRKKRISNVNMIISKITVSLTMKGISPATVYFYKV